MDGIFSQLYREVSPTVVTVQREGKEFHYGTGFVQREGKEDHYGTGFVLLSEERYSLIFTSASIIGSKHEVVVYFGEDFPRIAKVLCLEPKVPFAILIVETDSQQKAITFSEDPAKRQLITTIGAISSEGVLGNFKGFVFTPSCAAFDHSGQYLVGSEDYFLLKCTFKDEADDDYIDEEDDDPEADDDYTDEEDDDYTDEEDDDPEVLHTADTADKLMSAPVFGLNGTVVGIVASAGEASDVKIGLHTKAIYNYLKRLCGGAEWKKLLKGLAERFCNKERRTSKRERDDGAEGSKSQRQS